MPKYTKEQLEAQYEKLPDVLKDAIFSVEIAEKMFELGKKHGLTMEKTGFAAEETGFVILGLLPPREFAASLASRLDIDKEKSLALASDINHQVFFPLREALKDAHQIEVGESVIQNKEVMPRLPDTPMNPASKKPEMIKPPTPTPTAPADSKNIVPNPAPITKPTPAPIMLAPLLPVSPPNAAPPIAQKPIFEKGPEAQKTPELKKPPEAQKSAEPKKPPPIILRPKFADDLQKEIAPLIGDISPSALPRFITREQTEKIVAEKLAGQAVPIIPPLNSLPADGDQKSGIINEDEMPKIPPTIPALPPAGGLTNPITLVPLAGMPPSPPPLGTAKVPALDLRNAPKPPPLKTYDGFDPYKEPVE
ncbi:MAG: hypothetical protein WAP52_00600 [Candidatus Sungiibacteriota bacterium]